MRCRLSPTADVPSHMSGTAMCANNGHPSGERGRSPALIQDNSSLNDLSGILRQAILVTGLHRLGRRGYEELDEDGAHQSPTARPRRGRDRRHHTRRAVGPRADGRADPSLRGAGRSEDPRSDLDDRFNWRRMSTWPAASTPWPCKTDFAMSRPLVVTACMSSSSESWEP